MLWGLHSLGFEWEANDYFYFMQEVAQADDLQVMYGIQGERELIEETLDHLSGYDNARPVRIGNGAYNQRQHDVWGTMLDSIFLHAKSRDHLPERRWPLIERLVEAAIENWQQARPRHLGGARRGQALRLLQGHVLGGVRPRRAAGRACARRTSTPRAGRRTPTRSRPTSSSTAARTASSRSTTSTDALDASALLIPLVRFLPPDDERVRKTVMAIADNLTIDGLVLRYRVEETDDGLAGEEGTFTICSFWLVSALSEIGEHSLARDLCQKLLGYASPLHLYAEEIDPRSGRHLGNFPQAFTHLALINAVMHVIRADEKLAAGIQPLSAQDRRRSRRPDQSRRPPIEARRGMRPAKSVLGDGTLRRRRSARAFLRPPVLACSAPRLTALSISDTSLRCSVVICSSSPAVTAVSRRRKYVLICDV